MGFKIERPEVVEALAGLIEDGLARAYLLSSREPYATEIEGVPALDVIEENFRTYLCMTEKGMELHLSSDDAWPHPEPLP